MTPVLVACGTVVAIGASIAIGANGSRPAAIGVLVALVFTPFVAEPVGGSAILAYRIVAGTLAAFLLFVAGRRAPAGSGSPLGLPATLATAAAAFAAGLASTALDLPRFGTGAALAAGLASIAVAVGPVLLAQNALRLGSALVVLVNGALLLRVGLLGPPPDLEALLAGLALVALAVAVWVLAAAAAAATGDLAVPDSMVERGPARL